MKTIKSLLPILFFLLAPLITKAQFGVTSYGPGLSITYGGSNQTGEGFQITADSDIPPLWVHGVENHAYTSTGENYVFGGAYVGYFEFYYKKPGGLFTSWATVRGPNISTVNILAVGSSLTFTNGCETVTVTKTPGYSVAGATYNYGLYVTVYEACP